MLIGGLISFSLQTHTLGIGLLQLVTNSLEIALTLCIKFGIIAFKGVHLTTKPGLVLAFQLVVALVLSAEPATESVQLGLALVQILFLLVDLAAHTIDL